MTLTVGFTAWFIYQSKFRCTTCCVLQVVKKPGQDNTPIMSEMDLTYKERYTEAYIPEAYERLILDAIRGDQQHFVRR